MGSFTVIPQDTFDGLQLDAGVLLKDFDPASPAPPDDADIICATTGGITVSCIPTYSDMGADVDNCPNDMKELKKLDGWACKISCTSLGTSAESIKLALGAANINSAQHSIVPRRAISQADFNDLWWVGDKADGGLVAVQLLNALSTGGLSLKTAKNGKGQITLEFTGHVSIDDQDTMPMKFYSLDALNVTYTPATLTNGFVYGTKYFTRSGAGTSDNPYVYTEIPAESTRVTGTTYYIKTLT